jgi:hypothetical protein
MSWIDENPEKGLITGVNDSGDNLSPVTRTLAIKCRQCCLRRHNIFKIKRMISSLLPLPLQRSIGFMFSLCTRVSILKYFNKCRNGVKNVNTDNCYTPRMYHFANNFSCVT